MVWRGHWGVDRAQSEEVTAYKPPVTLSTAHSEPQSVSWVLNVSSTLSPLLQRQGTWDLESLAVFFFFFPPQGALTFIPAFCLRQVVLVLHFG